MLFFLYKFQILKYGFKCDAFEFMKTKVNHLNIKSAHFGKKNAFTV